MAVEVEGDDRDEVGSPEALVHVLYLPNLLYAVPELQEQGVRFGLVVAHNRVDPIGIQGVDDCECEGRSSQGEQQVVVKGGEEGVLFGVGQELLPGGVEGVKHSDLEEGLVEVDPAVGQVAPPESADALLLGHPYFTQSVLARKSRKPLNCLGRSRYVNWT